MDPTRRRSLITVLVLLGMIAGIGMLWFLSESDPCYALHGSCG